MMNQTLMLHSFQAQERLNDFAVQLKTTTTFNHFEKYWPNDEILLLDASYHHHLPCLSHGEFDTLRVQYETE